MKKNLFISVTVLFVICFVVSTAYSQPIVAGRSTNNSNNPAITFSPLTTSGFNVKLKVVAVFTQNPNLVGTVKDGHNWVLDYSKNPGAFSGATMYALGIESDWPGVSSSVTTLNATLLAKSDISSTTATFHFKNRYPKAKYYYQPVVWVIIMNDGIRCWGGHPNYPNGKFVVYNKLGEPQTWLKVDNRVGKILPPGKEGTNLATKGR